jgi:mono/diheme cytochrome c family protein
VTLELVNRGHERFNIYCSQCHGRTGDGNGMIPSRGYRRPPSFHTDTLRNRPTGHYFDVITNGFGAMPPYGKMIPTRDRWAIVAYVRALQLSQNATIDDVPLPERAKLIQREGGRRPDEGSSSQEGGH